MKSLAWASLLGLSVVAACGSDSSNTPDAVAADGGSDAPLADAGSACGEFPARDCPVDHSCDFPDNTCGATGPGVCVPRPGSCPLIYDPVCACDGQVHDNSCAAQQAGVDVNEWGGCTPPTPNDFACGWRFCAISSQYCRIEVSDVATIPNDYTCIALPPGCGNTPICDCLQTEPCGDICVGDHNSGLTLTCPGG